MSKDGLSRTDENHHRKIQRCEGDEVNIITESIQTQSGRYLRVSCLCEGIRSESDILAVLEACTEQGTTNLLIPKSCLYLDFFNLKTGVAGEIFHKLSVYQIRTVFVGQWAEIKNQRFIELMHECNKGNQFHFALNLDDAELWLTP